MVNLLNNTPNQLTEFRTKNQVKINDDARGLYNTNGQIKFNTSMLKSSLCNYHDAYILVKETIDADVDNANKRVKFKNYFPSIDCISEINNT